MQARMTQYHPLVVFFYFGLILVFSMIAQHPLCRMISLLGALGLLITMKGKLGFTLKLLLPMVLLASLLNPLFGQAGETVLAALPFGRVLTLESLFYGFSMAILLASVILWFSCYNRAVSSDQLLYLFGKGSPTLALLLSMALSFVPRLSRQFLEVSQAQESIGRGHREGSLPARFRNGLGILAVMLPWSLENAIQTGDSMRSRGYGSGPRSQFSLYTLEKKDILALLVLGASALGIVLFFAAGRYSLQVYPRLSWQQLTPLDAAAFGLYALFAFMPLLDRKWEERRWN